MNQSKEFIKRYQAWGNQKSNWKGINQLYENQESELGKKSTELLRSDNFIWIKFDLSFEDFIIKSYVLSFLLALNQGLELKPQRLGKILFTQII